MAAINLNTPAVTVNSESEATIVSSHHGERVFRFSGYAPYLTQDGNYLDMPTWEGRCVVCGGPFEVRSRSRAPSDLTRAFSVTTCARHRMTPSEAARLRFAKKADRPAVFARIRAEKLAAD